MNRFEIILTEMETFGYEYLGECVSGYFTNIVDSDNLCLSYCQRKSELNMMVFNWYLVTKLVN